MGDDISLKEFIEKLEERLDRFEIKLETLVTESRLQSKLTPIRETQEILEIKVAKVERFYSIFMFLLKYIGGPVASVAMAVLIAYLTGLI